MSGVTVMMMAADIAELLAEQWYDVKGSLLLTEGGAGFEVQAGEVK